MNGNFSWGLAIAGFVAGLVISGFIFAGILAIFLFMHGSLSERVELPGWMVTAFLVSIMLPFAIGYWSGNFWRTDYGITGLSGENREQAESWGSIEPDDPWSSERR